MLEKALEIKGLTKIYKNGTKAIQGIDLVVESGDFFALLGSNGAGKTTTIEILTGLIEKTSGEIKVFGLDYEKNRSEIKELVGLVPQEFNFGFFETLEDILTNQAGYYGIPRKIALKRAQELLSKLGLLEKRKMMAMSLSGGMKRRLMIARALIHDPKLLFLDEPTAGVDIELRKEMWEFLVELNKQGVTIILTTHYLEEAEQLCQNLAIVKKGLIIKNGKIKDLLKEVKTKTFLVDMVGKFSTETFLDAQFKIEVVDEDTVKVDLAEEQNLTDLVKYLDSKKLQVNNIKPKDNLLEELFLKISKN